MGYAPGEVLRQNHVDAAAGGRRKRALGRGADQFRATGCAANKEFTERNEVIELAPIQPRAKEIRNETTAHSRAAGRKREEVSVEPVAAELPGQSQPL